MKNLIIMFIISLLISFSFSEKSDFKGEYELARIERWEVIDDELVFEKSESKPPFTIGFYSEKRVMKDNGKWFRDFIIYEEGSFIQRYYESNNKFQYQSDGILSQLDENNQIVGKETGEGDFEVWYNFLISTWEYELDGIKYLGKNYWVKTNP